MSKKEEQTFPKEWYNECLDAFQEIKGTNLQGDEFAPRQRALKLIFKDGRKPEEVIGTMKFLENEKWYDWTLMKTVKMKIPEYLSWKNKREQARSANKEKMKELRQSIEESEKTPEEKREDVLRHFREQARKNLQS